MYSNQLPFLLLIGAGRGRGWSKQMKRSVNYFQWASLLLCSTFRGICGLSLCIPASDFTARVSCFLGF